jgi:hypothetical protein
MLAYIPYMDPMGIEIMGKSIENMGFMASWGLMGLNVENIEQNT